MSTARTALAASGTRENPIVLDGEPADPIVLDGEPAGPPAKRGRFDVRDGTGGTIRFRTSAGLESVAEEGSPSPDPTTESEHSQSSVSSGPVAEPETLPGYEEDDSDESEPETVCYQCGEPEGGKVTFSVERASGICDDCLQEDE